MKKNAFLSIHITRSFVLAASALVLFSCLSTPAVSPTNSPVINTPSPTFTTTLEPTLTETPVFTETATPRPTKTITSSMTYTRTPWIQGDITKISSYYGDWKITRYEFTGGGTKITKEEADAQIGLGMQLEATAIRFDKDFLFLSDSSCTNASYRSVPQSEMLEGGYYHFMLPDGHPDARTDRIFFDIYCNGKSLTGFEISKSYDIVFFWDNYFFFLEIINPQ
jgi:hypothetical protein